MLYEQIVERFPEQRLLRDARLGTERLQPGALRWCHESSDGHEIHGLAIDCFGALLGGHCVRLTCLL